MNEFELRRALKKLSPEREPGADLWPGIASRLDSRHSRVGGRVGWIAVAAAAVLALGLTVLHGLPVDTRPLQSLAGARHQLPLIADALAFEYEAAISTLPPMPSRPEALQSADADLEDAAFALRAALDQSPNSLYLLEQLRRTYATRLRLSRAAHVG